MAQRGGDVPGGQQQIDPVQQSASGVLLVRAEPGGGQPVVGGCGELPGSRLVDCLLLKFGCEGFVRRQCGRDSVPQPGGFGQQFGGAPVEFDASPGAEVFGDGGPDQRMAEADLIRCRWQQQQSTLVKLLKSLRRLGRVDAGDIQEQSGVGTLAEHGGGRNQSASSVRQGGDVAQHQQRVGTGRRQRLFDRLECGRRDLVQERAQVQRTAPGVDPQPFRGASAQGAHTAGACQRLDLLSGETGELDDRPGSIRAAQQTSRHG